MPQQSQDGKALICCKLMGSQRVLNKIQSFLRVTKHSCIDSGNSYNGCHHSNKPPPVAAKAVPCLDQPELSWLSGSILSARVLQLACFDMNNLDFGGHLNVMQQKLAIGLWVAAFDQCAPAQAWLSGRGQKEFCSYYLVCVRDVCISLYIIVYQWLRVQIHWHVCTGLLDPFGWFCAGVSLCICVL